MGNIGLAVGRIFRGAFNSLIYAYDPFAPRDAWSDLGHTRVDKFEDMLPNVDVLTLHLPLTPTTRNLIASPQFQLLKKNAILINAARGGIVNEDDLIQALNDGILYGAGLDCHNEEPPTLQRYEKLWATGRVISTPHIGATTSETQVHTATTAINRVYEYLTKV
jgi:phosphoglycerate dehydrogenase-like enzyme